jgi:tryptophan-rich sensory protein
VRWLALLFWVVVCFAVAALGARWTAKEIPGWYRTLVRPSFSPPDAVFGPVWTVLYLQMAVAA